MMDNNTFATMFCMNVKTVAAMRDYKIGDIEAAAGMSPGYLRRVISGAQSLRLDFACRIALALGVPLDDLCTKNIAAEEHATDFGQGEMTDTMRTAIEECAAALDGTEAKHKANRK